MKPNSRFLNQPKSFWANIRTISEQVGYTVKGKGQILVPSAGQIKIALEKAGLDSSHIMDDLGNNTQLGELLYEYFRYRAKILNEYVESRLMDVLKARRLFNSLKKKLKPKCPLPMNKQKGDKKTPAYFTGIINMLIETSADGLECDYEPRQLTTVTRDNAPLRTLSRRIDGAFQSSVNPIAVWEIKEYYYTTTFGSRVADGVYETLLDGMELSELNDSEGIHIRHYLMVDDYYTWWKCGRSYLCRLFDTLHMGYIDEVLFGHEVIERMPDIVREWVDIIRHR